MKHLTLLLGYVIPILILLTTSIVILHSVAPAEVSVDGLYLILFLTILFIVSRIDYHLFLFSPWPWYFFSLGLLAITLVVGTAARGSLRWVEFAGLTIQTSEIVKPLLLIFIGNYLTLFQPTSIKRVLFFGFLMLIPTFLVYIQPDLGSALLYVLMALVGVVVAGARLKHLLALTFIILAMFPLIYSNLKPYQRLRIESFIDPNADPLGSGYNALQATIAVGSGRLLGRGLGQGTQSHLRFLPERQTDFIFASTVEELGLVGGAIILLSYGWLVLSLLQTARMADADAGSVICLVTAGLVLMQALINIGMNMGMLPITGITLPLVSAGGSSLLSYAVIFGLCLSIARHSSTKRAGLEIR